MLNNVYGLHDLWENFISFDPSAGIMLEPSSYFKSWVKIQ